MQATGTFDVTLTPKPIGDNFDEDRFAQMSIRKNFEGDITGTSKGEMLSLHGHADGAAGYVAIEQISGTVNGKEGSFAVQHSCFMDSETQEQNLSTVPGSGAGELAGINGTMHIDIDPDGRHSYKFEFTLPT